MGRKKSGYWEHAEELKDNRFRCNFCKRKFSGGVSRIRAHLAGETGHDIAICDQVPPNVQAYAYLEIHGRNKKPRSVPISRSFGSAGHGDILSTRAPVVQTTSIRNMEEGPSMVTSNPVIALTNRPFQTAGCSSNGDILPTTTLAGETAKRNMEEIWECLINDRVRKIGVYGMAGVGKTTIMKHINNRLLKETDKFENVIWVSISNSSNVIKLQNEIACKLDLDLSKFKDKITRSAKLYAALKKRKRYVLILDDIWKDVLLEDIGIPESTTKNGCKLVLITRFRNICGGTDFKKIRVELLSEYEAWNLFLDIVGRDVLSTRGLKAIMKKVVEECACLPLAIIMVARSLKGEANDYVWRTTLKELTAFAKESNNKWSTVFEKLKLSYTRLKDEELQNCLLYCALYCRDQRIWKDDLIKNLIDEGIIQGMKSRHAEFDKGYTMLNELENANLLESCEDFSGSKCVKMHGLVRDMALQIASASHGFMVEAGKRLKDLPYEEKWKEDLVRISLVWNGLTKIPSLVSPRCPKLSTLMLNNNQPLERIPNSFFSHMLGLKVLNLSYTNIEYLPDSVFNLKNLTALVLVMCNKLKHVNSLGKLTTLRRLELENIGIEEIPQDLEMLVNLRHLNLYLITLKIFPTGVLSKFSHLQHFEFYWNLETLNLKVEEVANLKKLETFKGEFNDIHTFNRCVRFLKKAKVKPTNYVLKVGPAKKVCVSYYSRVGRIEDKEVILEDFSISNSRGDSLLLLPKDVHSLKLSGIHDFRSLHDVPSLNKVAGLKKLQISSCDGMDHIFSSSEASSLTLLETVEILHLSISDNLCLLIKEEGVASSPVPRKTFSQLKVFTMHDCNKIKKLFTPDLLLHLHNLEKIHVYGCNQLVNIVGSASDEVEENNDERNEEEGMDTTIFSLPKLRVLELWSLPKLKSICSSSSSQLMVCDSIQQIGISYCPMLKRLLLFLPLVNGQLCPPPSLNKIEASKEWWESLEWDHLNSKTVLQSFFVENMDDVTGDEEMSDEETSDEETSDQAAAP